MFYCPKYYNCSSSNNLLAFLAVCTSVLLFVIHVLYVCLSIWRWKLCLCCTPPKILLLFFPGNFQSTLRKKSGRNLVIFRTQNDMTFSSTTIFWWFITKPHFIFTTRKKSGRNLVTQFISVKLSLVHCTVTSYLGYQLLKQVV